MIDAAEEGEHRARKRSPKNRAHISTPLMAHLSDWCYESAPIKSGSLDHSSLNFSTYSKAFDAYRDSMKSNHRRSYSFSGFCGVLSSWSIKPTKYDKYACPLCYLLYNSGKSALEIEEDPHQCEKDVMWGIYREQIAKLKEGTEDFVVLIMDYARVHELGAKPSTMSPAGASILNFTFVLARNREVRLDFMAHGKQGYHFMKASMAKLATIIPQEAKGKKIFLWSDCGLKSYGTVKNVHSLSAELSVPIDYCYFPTNHGHSRCDSHFGRGKLELRKKFPVGGLNSTIQVLKTFNDIEDSFSYQIEWDATLIPGTWRPQWGIKSVQRISFNGDHLEVMRLDSSNPSKPDFISEDAKVPEWYPSPQKTSEKEQNSLPRISSLAPSTDLPVVKSLPDSSDYPSLSQSSSQRPTTFKSRGAFVTSPGESKWKSFDPSRYETYFFVNSDNFSFLTSSQRSIPYS